MKRFFLNWWLLTGIAVVLLIALLAFGLPLVVPFMRPWYMRLAVALFILAIWGLFAFLRIRKARKAAEALEKELTPPTPGDLEAEALGKRMSSALKNFKGAAGDKRDYLYSRPWYMIIGPPGAGKTTALLKSGVRFPFADAALKGVGGTRNLDFWFADEAVLVDTAGRYTTQDSDASVDQQGWTHFLKLLQKTRPLQPINGVLVALGLDELMNVDRQRLDDHAIAVRRRLTELRKTLEVSAPVYVLFTKVDLLAGFQDYFDDLDVEGRRAVLGATFSVGQQLSLDQFLTEFDAVAQALYDRISKRLQEEPDIRRRGLLLAFPAQIGSLRARLARFFETAFLSDETTPPFVRGFYFTSGVQEGAPLDRILSGVAAVYDQAPSQAAARDGGRAYFINRLLKDVVFAEAGLVSADPKAAARRRLQIIGGLAAVAAVSVLTLTLWTISFVKNRDLQNLLLTGAQNAVVETHNTGVDLVEVRSTDPDLEQALSVLRTLHDLPRGHAEREKGGPPLLERWGLFQSGHARQADQAYLEALQRVLLPRILLRLERYMQEHVQQPLDIYEPLKVYLMLGGQGPLDPKAVKAWVTSDWAENSLPGADRESVRKELTEHLDAMLEDKTLGRVWPARQAPLDGALIESTRAAVQTLSLADRAYAILRQKAATAALSGTPGMADWRADTVLASGDRQAFLNGDQVLQLSVPYFFTKGGYEKAYLPGLQTVAADLEKDLWVMGNDAGKEAIKSQVAQVKPGVAALYAREYISAWEGVVKELKPANYFASTAALGAFTRNPSPLKVILLELRKNTSFGGALNTGISVDSRLEQFGGRAKEIVSGGGVDAGKTIQANFKPLQDYVGDGKAPAPVDEFIGAVKKAASANITAGVAGAGLGGAAAQGQLATALGDVATAGVVAPPQLQGFVADATQSGKGAAVSSATSALGQEFAQNLSPACKSVVDNRFPFYGSAQNEAPAADMLRVLGLNGQFDSFSTSKVGPLLTTSGAVWRWRSEDPVGATLDPASAEQFQKAAQIRDLLTSGLPLKVSAMGFGGAVTSAEFSAGGQTYKFEPNTVGSRTFMWSLSSLPEAHLVLYQGAQEVRRFDAQGVWALFRLMETAQRENAGPTALKATFGQGAQFFTLKVELPSDKNPFGRGGLWSFRCPAKL